MIEIINWDFGNESLFTNMLNTMGSEGEYTLTTQSTSSIFVVN